MKMIAPISKVLILGLLFILASCSLPSPAEIQQPENKGGRSESVIAPSDSVFIPSQEELTSQEEATSPEEVVEKFFSGYIAAPEKLLRNRAYSSSKYLSISFINRLDQLLANKENLNTDPILMTQALPQSITFEAVHIAEKDARILVHQIFGIQNVDLTVDLVNEELGWRITEINKGNPNTPEGVVWLFYGDYIQYAKNNGNPLADQAYQNSPYLSTSFKERIHQQTAGQGEGIMDPLVMDQDIPDYFSTYIPISEANRASVMMECLWTSGKDLSLLKVYLVNSHGHWLIDNVTRGVTNIPVPLAPSYNGEYTQWELLEDEDFAFSLPFPPGWVVKPPEALWPPLPDYQNDEPMKRQYLLMPEEVFESKLSRIDQNTGSQRPGSAPEPEIPYIISIYISSKQVVEDSYPPAISITGANFNGHPAEIRILATHTVQYLFQHPHHPEVWLLFTDLISNEPRSEVQSRVMAGMLELMLERIEFME